MTSTDRIEKRVTLRAPVSRVWRAIADAREFGRWFGFTLDGDFAPGKQMKGTFNGVLVEEALVEHQKSLGLTPSKVRQPDHLEAIPEGTRLTIVESGFDRIPAHRRERAFRMNEGGWVVQAENLRKHVDGA